jgi:predicted ferric reductase
VAHLGETAGRHGDSVDARPGGLLRGRSSGRALSDLPGAAQAALTRGPHADGMAHPSAPRVTGFQASDRPASLWREPAVPPPATVVERPARRRPARPRHVVVDLLAAAAGIGLGITIALEVTAESAGSLSAPGGVATALGRLTGLLAAYAMVVVVLLVARVPPLERAIGQDRLVAWHRKLGPWPLYLLLAHAVLITVGYARQAHAGVLHELGRLLWTYPGILAATVGSILLFAAGISSYRLARRRMAYETWWSVHLYTYLALFLSFSHQVDTGASFVGHPATRAWWTALWVGTLAVVVAARVGLPVWRSLRHQVRVAGATPEGPGVVSVHLRGRRLDRLPVAGGQFLQWRFLRRGLWWQAHPYSLSAAPSGDELRITVKDLGDHSATLARLAPGTRVAIEGPYGVLTADAAERDRLLLVGAGVGTAPVLALLQELPLRADVAVLLRASTRDDLVLRDEVAAEVERRGGRLVELVGRREQVPLDAGTLHRLVPDLPEREVYLCGPEGLSRRLAAELGRAGVPERRVHFESFTF